MQAIWSIALTQDARFKEAPVDADYGEMEVYFVLDENGEPREERDLDQWQRWFEQADRGVARTAVSAEVTVLTTFRAFDELADPDAPPKLFETRVFGGVLDGEERAYGTRAEAVAAHASVVDWCRVSIAEGVEGDRGTAALE